MNQQRTELIIEKNPDKITKESKILAIGSRFSNQFATEFRKENFEIVSNPFGTIYNPLSVFKTIDIVLKNKSINQELITVADGKWKHFDFHADLWGNSRDELSIKLNKIVRDTNEYLEQTDFLIITLGSAFAYYLATTNTIVANCHKNSTNNFNKQLLSTRAIIESFRSIYNRLNHVKNIILVVSPGLHIEDSLTLNTVSKATLRLACHEIKNEFPHVKYFPAYEFLDCDLRDYSYYQEDKITPTGEAVSYMYRKFKEAYM